MNRGNLAGILTETSSKQSACFAGEALEYEQGKVCSVLASVDVGPWREPIERGRCRRQHVLTHATGTRCGQTGEQLFGHSPVDSRDGGKTLRKKGLSLLVSPTA